MVSMIRRRTIIARHLRRNMTDAEQRLWRALRELKGRNRFRRQHPVGAHIVDFACPAARLAIEVDGGQHAMMCEVDDARNAEIADHGYRVIRFWNNDVMENPAGVLHIIREELNVVAALDAPGTPTSPSPSPMRRVPSLSALRAERADLGRSGAWPRS